MQSTQDQTSDIPLISLEQAVVLLCQNWLPIHPSISEDLIKKRSFDYPMMQSAVDPALEMFYNTITGNFCTSSDKISDLARQRISDGKQSIVEEAGQAILRETQKYEGLSTAIRRWLAASGKHKYYLEKDRRYTTDDCQNFPLGHISLEAKGVSMGARLYMEEKRFSQDRELFRHLDVDEMFSDPFCAEYKIRKGIDSLTFTNIWYIKDGSDLSNAYMHFFAIAYNNLAVCKKNSV